MQRGMRILTPSLTAAVLTVGWFYAAPVSNVYAQSPPPPALSEPPPALSDQPSRVSEQKLDAAAAAIKQVTAVRDDYEQRIEAAPSNDRQRLAGEAKIALEKAVTDQGLSVPEYSSILVVAQNNPEVQKKLLQRLSPSENK